MDLGAACQVRLASAPHTRLRGGVPCPVALALLCPPPVLTRPWLSSPLDPRPGVLRNATYAKLQTLACCTIFQLEIMY